MVLLLYTKLRDRNAFGDLTQQHHTHHLLTIQITSSAIKMQLKYLLGFALASVCLAYTTVSQVETDIVNLDNAVKQLTASTAAYTGGVLLVQGIDFTIVEAKLTQGNADVTQLPPGQLSVSDTQSLVDLVASTLAIDNPRAVKTLKSKKQLIDAVPGQMLIVREGLQTLLDGHLYFSNQVLQRTPPAQLAEVQYYVDVISDALQDGVNAFSS